MDSTGKRPVGNFLIFIFDLFIAITLFFSNDFRFWNKMLISKQIFRNIPRKLSLSPHLQGLTAQSYRLDGLSRNEFLYYSQIFRFSKQKEDPEPIIEDEPNYNKDIKNEEDLFNSAVFKQKTFLEKHKLTFILLGGSAVCYTFGNEFKSQKILTSIRFWIVRYCFCSRKLWKRMETREINA